MLVYLWTYYSGWVPARALAYIPPHLGAPARVALRITADRGAWARGEHTAAGLRDVYLRPLRRSRQRPGRFWAAPIGPAEIASLPCVKHDWR